MRNRIYILNSKSWPFSSSVSRKFDRFVWHANASKIVVKPILFLEFWSSFQLANFEPKRTPTTTNKSDRKPELLFILCLPARATVCVFTTIRLIIPFHFRLLRLRDRHFIASLTLISSSVLLRSPPFSSVLLRSKPVLVPVCPHFRAASSFPVVSFTLPNCSVHSQNSNESSSPHHH